MVVLVAMAVAVAGPPLARQIGFDVGLPWSGPTDEPCPQTKVEITVTPELAEAVSAVVQPLQGSRLADGHCIDPVVTSQTAPEIVRKSEMLPAERAPQLWIPESSLWERQLERWALQSEGSLASSPLVVATSEAVVARLGWAARPPTWAQALSDVRPVAMPNLRSNASGVLSVLGLWKSLGRTSAADQAVTAAVLASTRSTAPTPSFVIDKAATNDPATPLLVTSEVNVFTTNRDKESSRLVAVYPQNGSPSLDYPMLRIAPRSQSSSRSIATDTVISALKATAAREFVRRAGLRDASGSSPGGAGLSTTRVNALEIPDPADTTAFLERLQSLIRPSRLSVVVDVSGSMGTLLGGSLTRAQLAGQAAAAASDLLSDQSSIGLWVFSRNLPESPPRTHFRQLDKLLPVGLAEAGRTHREVVNAHLLSLGDQVGGDGTALYASTLAAMKSATQEYDPGAVNSVVLFTDGRNVDEGGITLEQLLPQLTTLADPKQPVRLIVIGIGPEADLTVLRQLVAPSKGVAYRATTSDELKTILLDALARRLSTRNTAAAMP